MKYLQLICSRYVGNAATNFFNESFLKPLRFFIKGFLKVCVAVWFRIKIVGISVLFFKESVKGPTQGVSQFRYLIGADIYIG